MNALVMCLADPSCNPRPNRIIRLLASLGFGVDVIGFPSEARENIPVRRFFSLPRADRSFFGSTRRVYASVLGSIAGALNLQGLSKYALDKKFRLPGVLPKDISYDLVIVENLELLPFALSVKGTAKVAFDAREYYTREFEHDWRFRVFLAPRNRYLVRRFLRECDSAWSVSQGLANEYRAAFEKDVLVVRSVPQFVQLKPAKVQDGLIRCVHHGNANADRGLDKLIETIRGLDDRFTLDLYLVGSLSEQARLRRIARDCGRVRFLDPVPFDVLVPTLNAYDVGFYYLEPRGFNLQHCLPNKFFEFIQARLAIAIGPSPEMASLVKHYDCGVVAPSFSTDEMRRTLASLRYEDVVRQKCNSDIAAKKLCWEEESKLLVKGFRSLGLAVDESTSALMNRSFAQTSD